MPIRGSFYLLGLPAQQAFSQPSDVVNDPDLTLNEKRAIPTSGRMTNSGSFFRYVARPQCVSNRIKNDLRVADINSRGDLTCR